jgi:hypothetical protein
MGPQVTVAHYAFRIYHEGEIELLKQKFSEKQKFKSKTLRSASYRGLDKIWLKFVQILSIQIPINSRQGEHLTTLCFPTGFIFETKVHALSWGGFSKLKSSIER